MKHPAHVCLVDAHAKCNSRGQNDSLPGHPPSLNGFALFGSASGMVVVNKLGASVHLVPFLPQQCAQLFLRPPSRGCTQCFGKRPSQHKHVILSGAVHVQNVSKTLLRSGLSTVGVATVPRAALLPAWDQETHAQESPGRPPVQCRASARTSSSVAIFSQSLREWQ